MINIDYLNDQLEGKTWFAGDEYSMADIAVTTQLLGLEMAGFTIDKDGKWPELHKHMKKSLARDSFKTILK
jgi:glutathione S-transferase